MEGLTSKRLTNRSRRRGYVVCLSALGFVLVAGMISFNNPEGKQRATTRSVLIRRNGKGYPVRDHPSVAFFDVPIMSPSVAVSSPDDSTSFVLEGSSLSPLEQSPNLPDYNGLQMASFDSLVSPDNFYRVVLKKEDDERLYNRERKKFLKTMDRIEGKEGKTPERYYGWEDLDFEKQTCVRPKWTYDIYPACNKFHELSYERLPDDAHQAFDVQYLSHGMFRDSFRFAAKQEGAEDLVLKNLRMQQPLDRRNLLKVYTEATMMERLSASTRTSNIYGHCGSTVMVESAQEIDKDIVPDIGTGEPGRIEQRDLDRLQETDVHPMNHLTAEEKLDIAIQIAESLAEMHGFEGGVVTNDDIALDQWLTAADGRIILNDYNNAIYLSWNEEKQEYCKYWRSFSGTFKAPEEYDGAYMDESVDIWPMGNILYTLLTGLMPYYFETDWDIIQELTKQGPPHLDPRYRTRSFIEGRMVDIMNQCHRLRPEDRVDIFEVVRHLRETKQLHEQRKKDFESYFSG
jgi:serine/threonine protein kinase